MVDWKNIFRKEDVPLVLSYIALAVGGCAVGNIWPINRGGSQMPATESRLEERASADVNAEVAPQGISKVERLVEEFPKTIPGIARISKAYFPGSSNLLIHIQQTYADTNTNSTRNAEAIEVQNDIFKAIGFLRTNLNLNAVYTGGIKEVELAKLKEDKAIYFASKLFKPRPFKDQKEQETVTKFFNGVTNHVDAAQRAFIEYDGLDIRAAESSMLNGRAIFADIKYKAQSTKLINSLKDCKDTAQRTNVANQIIALIDERKKAVIGDREEYALRTIAGDFEYGSPDPSTNRVAMIVYGKAHKFKKSIADWNDKHPNNGFSYVSLTPRGQLAIESREMDEKIKSFMDAQYNSRTNSSRMKIPQKK